MGDAMDNFYEEHERVEIWRKTRRVFPNCNYENDYEFAVVMHAVIMAEEIRQNGAMYCDFMDAIEYEREFPMDYWIRRCKDAIDLYLLFPGDMEKYISKAKKEYYAIMDNELLKRRGK